LIIKVNYFKRRVALISIDVKNYVFSALSIQPNDLPLDLLYK